MMNKSLAVLIPARYNSKRLDKKPLINIKFNSEEKYKELKEEKFDFYNLEDKNNEYRAIFAVDKLNEGWDVLNLFDIVIP